MLEEVHHWADFVSKKPGLILIRSPASCLHLRWNCQLPVPATILPLCRGLFFLTALVTATKR